MRHLGNTLEYCILLTAELSIDELIRNSSLTTSSLLLTTEEDVLANQYVI